MSSTRARLAGLAAVAAIAIVVLISVSSGSFGDSSRSRHRKAEPPRISPAGDVQLVERLVGRYGGHKPDYILTTDTTQQRALKVLFAGESIGGPDLQPQAPVHIVVAHGDFVDYAASPPRSRQLGTQPRFPEGKWLTLVVVRKTGLISGVELGDKKPPIQKLGKVRRTDVPAA